jgi:type IV secretory pathway VirB2 component (pilin)
MSGSLTVVLYVAIMVAIVVGADLAFFRNHFWERLMVNVGIVLVFGAFYFRFLGRPWAPWR